MQLFKAADCLRQHEKDKAGVGATVGDTILEDWLDEEDVDMEHRETF